MENTEKKSLRGEAEAISSMADINRKMTRKVKESRVAKRKMARLFSEMGMADVFEKVWLTIQRDQGM